MMQGARALMDHSTTSMHVIPAEQAGLSPASESRNPVTNALSGFTQAIVYCWGGRPPTGANQPE